MTVNLNGRNILVTGAGGFIGSHLVEQLVAQGAKVRAFVRYNSRADAGLLKQVPAEILQEVEIIAGDLRDEDAIRSAVKECQVVFHLGALISIPYSYLHPVEVASTNMMGTLNVLVACRDLGVERMVHTSTSEVYGTALRVPIDESHPLQGQSPYSASKIGADKLAESFYCAYGLPVITVRPFNTFGPRQSARAVIPTIITQALTCDEIHLGNLETTRDFTYVSDTVTGFIKAAEAEQGTGQVFNLGTGEEIRIGDLANLIIQKVGRPVKLEIESQRLRPKQSEVFRLLSNNMLARETLGWQPQVSFDQGLDLTIEWIKQHLDLYRIGKYEF
jgi:dTDP-glucose 4,6-dehydratase